MLDLTFRKSSELQNYKLFYKVESSYSSHGLKDSFLGLKKSDSNKSLLNIVLLDYDKELILLILLIFLLLFLNS